MQQSLKCVKKIYLIFEKKALCIVFSVILVSGLSGCLSGKWRYEGAMNETIESFQEYQIANEYYNAGDYQEALSYYEQALKRIEEEVQPETTMEYWIKGRVGECYTRTGELEKAGAYLEEARIGLEKKDQKDMLDIIYIAEAEYYVKCKQYEAALKSYEKAEEYVEEDAKILIYRWIADVYADMDMEEEALEYYNRAIDIGKQTNDIEELVKVYYSKGIFLALTGKLDGAKGCFAMGKEYAASHWKEDDARVARAYSHLARVSSMEQDYETAYSYTRKAMDIYSTQDGVFEVARAYNNMVYLNVELGNYDAALKMARKAIDTVAAKMETDEEFKRYYEDDILSNIKFIYEEFILDGTDYDSWFEANFGT